MMNERKTAKEIRREVEREATDKRRVVERLLRTSLREGDALKRIDAGKRKFIEAMQGLSRAGVRGAKAGKRFRKALEKLLK